MKVRDTIIAWSYTQVPNIVCLWHRTNKYRHKCTDRQTDSNSYNDLNVIPEGLQYMKNVHEWKRVATKQFSIKLRANYTTKCTLTFPIGNIFIYSTVYRVIH